MAAQRGLLATGLVGLVLAAVAVDSQPPQERTPDDAMLLKLTRERESMTRITREPYRVPGPLAGLCRAATTEVEEMATASRTPHSDRWIHVYATSSEKKRLETGRTGYAVGSIILKEKLLNDSDTELFTGMLKRKPGYNPDCGDWEFFVVSGDAKNVVARGRIESCMECHKAYPETGFVVRDYLDAERTDIERNDH